MAPKTTLNAKNLESLGAATLAELLIEISTGSAAAKRRLRLALAGGQGPREAAAEIRKRLATIGKSRAQIGWQQRKVLIDDLASQSRAILDQVAPTEPGLALDLAWQFLSLAEPLFDRCDDSSGALMGLFHGMVDRLGPLAQAAQCAPETLAERVLDAVLSNQSGQYDGLIPALAAAFGTAGLLHLRGLMANLGDLPTPPEPEWRRVGFGTGGPVFAHELDQRRRRQAITAALTAIADALGDVDGFMAAHTAQQRKSPQIAATIATRLLSAGRAAEALNLLEQAEIYDPRRIPAPWQAARLAALDALGRGEEAQALRWQEFATTLAADPLRAHLKRLPDFEDIEVEERAMALVAAWPQANQALAFLVTWPALSQAAALIMARHDDLNGEQYEILVPAAEALAPRHPLAALLALRAMIDFALMAGRASRYGHAAAHLLDCASLDAMIGDYGDVEPHHDYITRLRAEHPRKSSFWDLVDQAGVDQAGVDQAGP